MLHPNDIVGVGVLDDPSGKFDLDGQIFPHTALPPDGGRDVGDAIPCKEALTTVAHSFIINNSLHIINNRLGADHHDPAGTADFASDRA